MNKWYACQGHNFFGTKCHNFDDKLHQFVIPNGSYIYRINGVSTDVGMIYR